MTDLGGLNNNDYISLIVSYNNETFAGVLKKVCLRSEEKFQ